MSCSPLFRDILIRLAKGEDKQTIAPDIGWLAKQTFARLHYELGAWDNVQAVIRGLCQEWITLEDIFPDGVQPTPPDCSAYPGVARKLAEGYEREEAGAPTYMTRFFKRMYASVGVHTKMDFVLEALRRRWFSLDELSLITKNPFTETQRVILRLVWCEAPGSHITSVLGISPSALAMHRSRIKSMTGVESIEGAARIAYELGYF